jgi:hypothetical protein
LRAIKDFDQTLDLWAVVANGVLMNGQDAGDVLRPNVLGQEKDPA